MPADESKVAIVFADVCDSTPLYETHGDERALAIVASRLDELAVLAAAHRGEVIRSKGDDVLCIFDDPCVALDAAAAMVDAHGDGVAPIHVGIHFGPVIHARDDIFGDAVNIAARILALAKPGEIVASEDLVNALDPWGRARMSLIGRRDLKGRQEPLGVYSMVLDDGDVTQMASGRGDAPAGEHIATMSLLAMVELEHAGRTIQVRDGERCRLGRSERCDVVIESSMVSRDHAWIEVSRGRARVTDRSSTGTWVLPASGGHTTLRRESAELKGSGRLRLGRHPRDREPAVEIAFRIDYEQ